MRRGLGCGRSERGRLACKPLSRPERPPVCERLAGAGFGDEAAFRLWRQSEIFARAYAQYVAVKSGDPVLLEQLEETRQRLVDTNGRKVYYPEQWADDDFAPLMDWFEKEFAARGWLQ